MWEARKVKERKRRNERWTKERKKKARITEGKKVGEDK